MNASSQIAVAHVPMASSEPHESLWTVTEYAAYLKRSPHWVWSAMTRPASDAGSIPHVRLGSSPRFFPDDVAAWVRAGCPPAATIAEWNAAEQKRQKRAG